MNTQLRLTLTLFLVISLAGCASTLTPLPGWRSPVSELFVDESVFPEGWHIDFPEDTASDPTANHVGRSWGRVGVSGTVAQGIWRAYTAADAERKYAELHKSQFQPNGPLYPDTVFIEFEPPAEIRFQSQIADEFYLACGWWGVAYCGVVARYRNYVVYMRLEREAEYEGHVSEGLTYPEIEAVVKAMDTEFAEAMETFYPSPP